MVSVLSAVRDLARLREITSVLVRHGFGEIVMRAGFGRKRVDAKPSESFPPDSPVVSDDDALQGERALAQTSTPERIRLVLQDLGPSFIKLGQIASTRADIIPASVIHELKKLQDNVPPVPFVEIKKQIEDSFGLPLSELYETFDENPLATASIGQVHRALLRTENGLEHVVVKVQRPKVAQTVVRDLELLHLMAQAIERTIPEAKLYNPRGLVEQFDQSIMAELNFLLEAENGIRLAENFADNPFIQFPKVYKKASSKFVLTQEFFDGKKIDKAIADGYDGKALAKGAVGIVIKMVFEDGFFHADPHPGNILILGSKENPVIGLIDLGMVGKLSPELRDRTVDLMVAAARKDSESIADALYAIGRPSKKIDMREFRGHVGLMADKYLGKPLKELELSALFRDLVQSALKFEIEVPADFMMVGKALMTLEGIAKDLDPDLDVYAESQPYFLEILKKRYSPEKLGNDLIRGFENLSRAGYNVPMQVREVLDDLRLGRLTVKTDLLQFLPIVDSAAKRVFSGFVFMSCLGSGTYLFANNEKIVAMAFYSFAMLSLFANWVRRKP